MNSELLENYQPKVMTLVKFPDERLRKVSEDVTEFNDDLLKLALDMAITLHKVPWGNPVGLAAPQVGVNKNIFLALGTVYVNPKIKNISKGIDFQKEGCYSLEQFESYNVSRPQTIWVTYQDIDGNEHEEKLNGLKARVFLHELDHLQGKLCLDKA